MLDLQLIDRHFCVTVYIYKSSTQEFLMIKHKKLGKWLPPGGHIENNETPDAAAIRECKEETGMDINLVGDIEGFEGSLVRPLGVQVNVIEKNCHEHIDIIYKAKPLSSQYILNTEETDDIGWFNIQQINDANFDTFDSIKHWCNKISE